MGNREALLAGAKSCLYEKGFSRTTARDIASASGVSLAAIGYHFGSKDALMNTALMTAIEEWADALAAALGDAGYGHATPEERFVAGWDRVLETFVEHRELWVAQFEMMAQAERAPELKAAMAAVQREARLGLSALFQGKAEVPDNETEISRGTFYQALLAGLAAQWLLSPEQAPSGRELFRGLQAVSADVLGTG